MGIKIEPDTASRDSGLYFLSDIQNKLVVTPEFDIGAKRMNSSGQSYTQVCVIWVIYDLLFDPRVRALGSEKLYALR